MPVTSELVAVGASGRCSATTARCTTAASARREYGRACCTHDHCDTMLVGLSTSVDGFLRDRSSDRRNIRAVPALLRGAAGARQERRRNRGGARRDRLAARHVEQPRRDAHRRRHRSRDRVVPQRPVARLQDRRRHRPESAVAVPPARRSADGVWRARCGRWSSTRPTTRWRRRR